MIWTRWAVSLMDSCRIWFIWHFSSYCAPFTCLVCFIFLSLSVSVTLTSFSFLCHEWGGGCLPCRDGVCIDQAKVGRVCVCVGVEGVLLPGLTLDQGTINAHPHPHESLGFSGGLTHLSWTTKTYCRCLLNKSLSPVTVAYDPYMLSDFEMTVCLVAEMLRCHIVCVGMCNCQWASNYFQFRPASNTVHVDEKNSSPSRDKLYIV